MASRALSRLRSRKASGQARTSTGRFTTATRARSSAATTASRGTSRVAQVGLLETITDDAADADASEG